VQDHDEPPLKKLAIREEAPESDKYDFITEPRMLVGDQFVPLAQDDKVSPVIVRGTGAELELTRSDAC
jgi:hypothetical protein